VKSSWREDLAGIAVHIAARIAGLARRGEFPVPLGSDLGVGSGLRFDDYDGSVKAHTHIWGVPDRLPCRSREHVPAPYRRDRTHGWRSFHRLNRHSL
jgi:hypothetical protein